MKSIRRSLLLAGFGCLLAAPALVHADGQHRDQDQLQAAPADVMALAGREVGCKHWLSVEITDEESDARVEQALSHLRCDALAADAAALRAKYGQSEATLRALDAARALGP
jgi:hypothetical protein